MIRYLLAAVTTLFWLGFMLHTSHGEDLVFDKYSPKYAVFLLILTVSWLSLLTWAWRNPSGLASSFRTIAIIVVVTLGLAALLLPGAYIYLHNRSLDGSVFQPINPAAHAFFQYEVAPNPRHGQMDEKPALRVLALGGSTTYGTKLEREQAYPSELERLLKERFPDLDVEVLNAGVSWHTTMHSLLRYVARYADWKPHVVIVMHAFNDIYQTSEGRLAVGEFRPDYGHFFGALGQKVNVRDKFRDRIRRAISNNWFIRTWYSDLNEQGSPGGKETVDLYRALPSFKRNLMALATRVGQDGSRFILATQPFSYRQGLTEQERENLFYDFYYRDYAFVPTIDQQREAMLTFNQETRNVALQTGAALVDLEESVPKSSDYMFDDVHYTVAGAKRVASVFAEEAPWEEVVRDVLAREP